MSRKNHRHESGRAQASKNRRPAPLSFPQQQTAKNDCPTGIPGYGHSVAKAIHNRSGGTIIGCPKCDWYHVVDE